MHRSASLGVIIGVVAALALAAPEAGAVGGGGSSSSASAGSSDWKQAKRAIAAKDYDAAVPLLKKVVTSNPKNADAFNYLGYAYARAGNTDDAMTYYKQALAIKPKHKGANEYLGELYLKMGNLKGAEERLKVLDDACLFGCAEYDLLKEAVQHFKDTGRFTSSKGL